MHANVFLCCMKVNEGKCMLSRWYPFRSKECLVFKSILYHYIWAHRLANCIVSYSSLEERVTSRIVHTLWWISDIYQKQMHWESEMQWLLGHVNQYGYGYFFFLCWSLKNCCSSNPVSHPPVAISVVPHSIPLASQVTLPQTHYFIPSFLSPCFMSFCPALIFYLVFLFWFFFIISFPFYFFSNFVLCSSILGFLGPVTLLSHSQFLLEALPCFKKIMTYIMALLSQIFC